MDRSSALHRGARAVVLMGVALTIAACGSAGQSVIETTYWDSEGKTHEVMIEFVAPGVTVTTVDDKVVSANWKVPSGWSTMSPIQFNPPPPSRQVGLIPVFGQTGVLLGFQIIKVSGDQVITERFAKTDEITSVLSDSKDPVGVGIVLTYNNYMSLGNNIMLSPFVSLDYPNISITHTFPGGTSIGTRSNVQGTLGVKVGTAVAPNLAIYGIAGVSAMNETLNIRFASASSDSDTVAGGTLGVGAAFQPAGLRGFGKPMSLFLEYQHTWWQDAHFDRPAASPLFNYTVHREDNTIKFGFNIPIGDQPRAPPARTASMPLKAPRLK
ncbi:MAG: hypothetical protein C5B57_00920 [Blastocatellia bacterium]|nr:MAG: hypothetical protein C5B57_00920 [Blastocatellia bacterium]